MDCPRDAFRRLSPQDEGMMGSPHSTPIKKVRWSAEARNCLSCAHRRDSWMRICALSCRHGHFLCYASHDAFWNLLISQSLRPLVLFLTLFLNRTNLWLFRPTNRDHGRAPSRRVQKSRRKPWKQSACPKKFLSNLLLNFGGFETMKGFVRKFWNICGRVRSYKKKQQHTAKQHKAPKPRSNGCLLSGQWR